MNKILREKYELSADELRYQCDIKEFNFKDTSQVKLSGDLEDRVIGQEKAKKSIKDGLAMNNKHNHIFLAGPKGTGKSTVAELIIKHYINSPSYEKLAEKRDIVAVANFENPDNPILIAFESGKGAEFVNDLDKVIKHITEQGMAVFSQQIESGYMQLQKMAEMVTTQYEKAKENYTLELFQAQDEIKAINEQITQLKSHDSNNPEIEKLNKEKRDRDQLLLDLNKKLNNLEIEKRVEHSKLNTKQLESERETETQWIKDWVKPNIAELRAKYSTKELETYLQQIGDSLETDVKTLIKNELAKLSQRINPTQFMLNLPELDLSQYEANLLLDSSKTDDIPLIIEREPTLENLFGIVKKPKQLGDRRIELKNNQHIRLSLEKNKGSYFKAHGGYLILDAMTTILNGSWGMLQKFMLSEKAAIQEHFSFFLGLDPIQSESIETKVKVILKGPNWLYTALNYKDKSGLAGALSMDPSTPQEVLEAMPTYKGDIQELVRLVNYDVKGLEIKKSFNYVYEESFRKLFKVKAEFDVSVKNDEVSRKRYVNFVSQFCNKEKLNHLTPEAVTEVIEKLARDADSQEKLTLFVGDLENLIREANKEAIAEGSREITDEHIKKAIKDKRERHNLVEEKRQEYMAKNIIVIETSGEKIGELNGLVVLDTGDIRFGGPSRITVSTPIKGKRGIVCIHEEAGLSGEIEKKGNRIFNSIIKGRYLSPISEHHVGTESNFDCTIDYEQTYSMVDGDSASSTGLYVSLSALGQIPLDQSIAVTGRVSQKGEIQAIGGVNEKIEGFYNCCKAKGLTGKQGVMIPKINVKDLMLSNEIIETVKKGDFHIYSVSTMEEGLEVLSGLKMDSIDEMVSENLKKFTESTERIEEL